MQAGGEHVADVAFTHQGGFVVCLTKDERLVLLTGSGMLLRTFSTAAAREPNLSPPAPKISLKKLYDQTAVRLPIGALFLSVSAAAATNSAGVRKMPTDILTLPVCAPPGPASRKSLISTSAWQGAPGAQWHTRRRPSKEGSFAINPRSARL